MIINTQKPVVSAEDLSVNIADSIRGLSVSWASATTLTIAAGYCRDSTGTFYITLSSAATINSAVVGVNGLDTGTIAAAGTYAVYVIGDSRGYMPTATLISTSTTAPYLPSGYDIFRRIGWALTSSSNFVLLYQSGSSFTRTYTYDEPVSILSGGSSATFTAIDLSNKCPAVDNTKILISAAFTPNAADDTASFRKTGSAATTGHVITGEVAAKITQVDVSLIVGIASSAPKIDYAVTASGALTALLVAFDDNL